MYIQKGVFADISENDYGRINYPGLIFLPTIIQKYIDEGKITVATNAGWQLGGNNVNDVSASIGTTSATALDMIQDNKTFLHVEHDALNFSFPNNIITAESAALTVSNTENTSFAKLVVDTNGQEIGLYSVGENMSGNEAGNTYLTANTTNIFINPGESKSVIAQDQDKSMVEFYRGRVLINEPDLDGGSRGKNFRLKITQDSSSASEGLTFYNTVMDSSLSMYLSPSGLTFFNVDTGDIVATIDSTSGVYSSLSDSRLKENINSISNSDLLYNLNPIDFNFINSTKKSYGFLAQEVESVFPELVKTVGEDTKTLDYTSIIPLLVKEIQLLNQRITTLENV